MPAVANEGFGADSSPFADLNTASVGYSYPSLRHNRYWKHTMAAWASIDVFCSSFYDRKVCKNALPSHEFATDVDGFNEMLSPKSLPRSDCHSAEVNQSSFKESQNKIVDSPQKDDDSDVLASHRSCGGKSSSLIKSTSASSLARDVTFVRSASPSPETPSLALMPASQRRSRKDLSHSNARRDLSKYLRKSSSLMLNSKGQRLESACNSSASISNFDSGQRTSQDNSVDIPKISTTPSTHSTTPSTHSTSNVETPEASDSSCNRGEINKIRLDRPYSSPQNKLCDVCKEPYTSHKELVLLSPGLFRRTARTRRSGRRSKRTMPNRKCLYRRRSDMNDPTLSYCSLISSNFLLSKELQNWVGRHLGHAANEEEPDNDAAANDSSNESETFSESLKSKLYELIKQIKSHAGPISSARDVTKDMVTPGSHDVDDSNTVLGNDRENEQRGYGNYGKHSDTTVRAANDAGLQTSSDTNTLQVYAVAKDTLENTTQPKQYNDSSQTTLGEPLSNAVSISDPHEMSHMKGNPHGNPENVYFQDICHKPGKSYIDNRKSRRRGGQSSQIKGNPRQENQENMDISKEAAKNEYREQEKLRELAKRHIKRNEDAHWEIMDDGRPHFSQRKINFSHEGQDVEFPARRLDEVAERQNVAINLERKMDKETTGVYEKVDLKERNEQGKARASGRKFHYKCVKIGDRETIMKMEHSPNTICDFKNSSSAGKETKKGGTFLRECKVPSGDFLEEKGKENKVENVKVTETSAENTKPKSEQQRIWASRPCREAKPKEKGTQMPNEIAADEEDDDDDDNCDEKVKYSKVFHKNYSRIEAEKERRMMRRFALERLKANDEKTKLEGETPPLRKHLPWPDIFMKLLKRKQKHSNKKCIVGKRVMSTDNPEEDKENADAGPTDGASATVEEDAIAKGEVESAAATPGESADTQPPSCSKTQSSSNFPGMSFFERFLRVPEPVQMTNVIESETETLSHLKDMKALIAEYHNKYSQDEPKVSKIPDNDEEITSRQSNNKKSEQANNKIIMQSPASKTAEIPKSSHLSLKSKFKTNDPSFTKESEKVRGDSSKASRNFSKKEEMDPVEEKKQQRVEKYRDILQPDFETSKQILDPEIPQEQTHKQMTPTGKSKTNTSSTTKYLKSDKANQDFPEISKKSEKDNKMTYPDFQDGIIFERKSRSRTKPTTQEQTISDLQEPTQLTSKRKFKIFSQSYNKKLKASAVSFFLKTIERDSKAFKKIVASEGMASPHFKDTILVQQANTEADTLKPQTEIPQDPMPSLKTPKRQFTINSHSHTEKVKEFNNEYFNEVSHEHSEMPKKNYMAEEAATSPLEDSVYIEPTEEDFMMGVPESAVDRVQGSELANEREDEGGDVSETPSQDVKAGNMADENISMSQESLFQQIYSKLLEPVGLKIVDDLEQFGHRNRPLKYRIPASQRLYSPPGSRPVYLSEFLTWLGVKPTDSSSSDDGGRGDDEDKKEKENAQYRTGRKKYSHKQREIFPRNVKVATSATYLKTQQFDKFKEIVSTAESSFISRDSQQIFLNEEGLEDIPATDLAYFNTTFGQVKDTSKKLIDQRDRDPTPPEPPSTPPADSKDVPMCESPSKVFHKKYRKKEKLEEKEKIGERGRLPWRKKERVFVEASTSKNKKSPPSKNLFAKQAVKSRERQKKEEELKKDKGKAARKIIFKGRASLPGLDCCADDEIFEYEMGDSNADEQPCRVCLSSEDYKKAKESSTGKGGDRGSPRKSLNKVHQALKVSPKEVGEVKDADPGSPSLRDQDDVEYGADQDAVEKQAELQQSASESYSMMDAVNELLKEIPIDVISRKFMNEMISFRDRNIPLQFKLPSINERMRLENAEPIYLSQFLSILKKVRSKSRRDDSGAKSSEDSDTSESRPVQHDPLPKYLRRAGSFSHLMSRRYNQPRAASGRSGFLSVPTESVSLSRDLANVSNVQIANIDQSVSFLTSEASETIAEIIAPDVSQTDTVDSVQGKPPDSVKSPSKIFHKKFSTEGKIREKEKLGNWIEKPCKKEEEEEVKVCRCRDPKVIEEEELPPKKNVFVKQAERRKEREQQEKMEEEAYEEIFAERPCRDFRVKVEVCENEDGRDERGDGGNETKDVGPAVSPATSPPPIARSGAPSVPPSGAARPASRPGGSAAVKGLVDGKKIVADGSAATEERDLGRLDANSQFQVGDEMADMSDVVVAGPEEFTGGSSQFLQAVSEKLISQNLLNESRTTTDRSRPFRYTIPSSCEMYEPPEARPIYIARETSDKILSFLGLDQREREPAEEPDSETFDRNPRRSPDRYSWRGQEDVLATLSTWRPELTVDRILPYLRSKFLRTEMASGSSHRDTDSKRFHDFQPSDDRYTPDFATREYHRTRSPSYREKTKAQPGAKQVSPKDATKAEKEFIDPGLDRYGGLKILKVKSPPLEIVTEEDSQLEDSLKSGTGQMFRWVGKSRIGELQMVNNRWLVSGEGEGVPKKPETLAQTSDVQKPEIPAIPADLKKAQANDVKEAEKAAKATENIGQQKVQVFKEVKAVPASGSYFKGTFSKSFEESPVGAVAVKILDQIVDFGRRNIPLQFEARPQEFLEMPAAAKPIYISRKDLNKAFQYLGLDMGDGEGDDESCRSDTSLSSYGEAPIPKAKVIKPRDESAGLKEAVEEGDNAPDDEVPQGLHRVGTVDSHRELTFVHPAVPLPKRTRWSIRRQTDPYDYVCPVTCTGFVSRRSKTRSEISGPGRDPVCYGRTKQLKRSCDIWARSELDRSSHFSKFGRYYRKHLFRKRLSLRNILKECERSKEWRKLERSFRERDNEQGYSNGRHYDCVNIEPGAQVEDVVENYDAPEQAKHVTVSTNASNVYDDEAGSKKLNFVSSSNCLKGTLYNRDRCSNRREEDPWAFPERRTMLDLRPGAQGDYINTNFLADCHRCSSSYRNSQATSRNDAQVFSHSERSIQRTHDILAGFSEMKRSSTIIPPLPQTSSSFGNTEILQRVRTSKNSIGYPESYRWRDKFSTWRGCHSNVLPIATTPADIMIGKRCFLDINKTQMVNQLGGQQNKCAYHDVKFRYPYTSSYYKDDTCTLPTLAQKSFSFLPLRMH